MDTENKARTRAACADCCAIALSAALPLAASPPLAADGIERLGDWLGQPLRERDSRWHGLQAVVGVFSSLVMTCFCMDLT